MGKSTQKKLKSPELKESEIALALDGQCRAIDGLENAINQLGCAVTTVLRNVEPENQTEEIRVDSAATLVNSIWERTDRIEAVKRTVQGYLDRCAL